MVFTQQNAISWLNARTGELGAWTLTDGRFSSGNTFEQVSDPNWKLKGAARMNSDNAPDYVFQNEKTGQVGIWYSKAGGGFDKITLNTNPGTTWRLEGVGDLNNDGFNDLFFTNPTTNESAVWYFNGTTRKDAIATSYINQNGRNFVATNLGAWKFGGIADFNNDGKADIVWQNGNEIGYWIMDGDKLLSVTSSVSSNVNGWTMVGVNDFNNDGKADILWRKGDQVGFWEMNGQTFVRGSTIGTAPAEWTPVSTFDKAVSNPLAQYTGVSQTIQLNFSSDLQATTSKKQNLINLAGIVEQALGGRTNLPENFTLKLSVNQSTIDLIDNLAA